MTLKRWAHARGCRFGFDICDRLVGGLHCVSSLLRHTHDALEPLPQGVVRIGGTDAKDLDARWLRDSIGFVTQVRERGRAVTDAVV